MMAGHTQATISKTPWHADQYEQGWLVNDSERVPVAFVSGRMTAMTAAFWEAEANARLIAEAPNLLEICRHLLALADRREPLLIEDVAAVRSVVDRAEGRREST